MVSQAFAQGYDATCREIIGMGKKAATEKYMIDRRASGDACGPEMLDFFEGCAEALGDA